MVENMQLYSVKLCALIFAVGASIALLAAAKPAMLQTTGSGIQQYCNEQYGYCVSLPSSGMIEPHEGDAPNHGVSIKLPELENGAWTYAHWDAALLEGTRKVALRRLEISLLKHSNAQVRMAPTMLAGLHAYRIRLEYKETLPTIEELVIAYRKPRTESESPGIIYEIGLKCSKSSYPAGVSVLEALISSFKLTGNERVGVHGPSETCEGPTSSVAQSFASQKLCGMDALY